MTLLRPGMIARYLLPDGSVNELKVSPNAPVADVEDDAESQTLAPPTVSRSHEPPAAG
jgi:hypothetical protein